MPSKTVYATLISIAVLISATGLILGTESNEFNVETDEFVIPSLYDGADPPTYEGFTYTVSDNKITITGYTGSEVDITIPSEIEGKPVTRIGNSAFKDKNIENVVISGNVTDIESSAFYGSGLISVTIPESVTRIATQAFRDCKSLEILVMEATLSTYGTQMFFNCIKLDNVVLPEGWKSIPGQMFTLCSSLTNITIPESVTKIDNYAFDRCEKLVGIEIPSNVTTIGNCAFEECVKLENIVIPSKVTSIGSKAFADCKKLERISFLSDEAPGITNDIFKSSNRVTIYHKKEATGFDQGIWGSLSVTKVPVPALNIIDELEAKSENSNSIRLSWTFSDTADEVYSSGIPLTHQIFYKITDSEEWIEYTGTIDIDMSTFSILLNDVYGIGPTEFKMVISEEYLGQSVEYGPVITQYLMTWNINGIEDAKYLDNGAVLEIPKKAGYKLSDMPVCLNMPTEDLSITASWVQIVYTIVFENEDGTYFQDSISNKYYGDVVVIPALSDKAGYKPGVWVIKGTAIEITDFNDLWGYAGQTIEDTITLTAIYKPIEYTVEFVTEDGIAPDSIEVYFKDPESGELPAVNQKTGYNGKWIISGTDIEIENFDDIWDNIGQAVGTVITLKAEYESIVYIIEFNSMKGEYIGSIEADVTGPLSGFPDTPVESGYEFKGWYIGTVKIEDGVTELSEYLINEGVGTVIITVANYKIIVDEDDIKEAVLKNDYLTGYIGMGHEHNKNQTPLKSDVLNGLDESVNEIEYKISVEIMSGKYFRHTLTLTTVSNGHFEYADANTYKIFVKLDDENSVWAEGTVLANDVFEIEWTIMPKNIEDEDVTAEISFADGEFAAEIKVFYNGSENPYILGTNDYEIDTSDSARIVVNGKGNYTGEKTFEIYTIVFVDENGNPVKDENGDVISDITNLQMGDEVTFIDSEKNGYEFFGWSITVFDEQGEYEYTEDADKSTIWFSVVDENNVITVTAKFKVIVDVEYVRELLLEEIYRTESIEMGYVYDTEQSPLLWVVLAELSENQILYGIIINIEGENIECTLALTGDLKERNANFDPFSQIDEKYVICVELDNENFVWGDSDGVYGNVLEIGWNIIPKNISHSDVDVRYELEGGDYTLRITDNGNVLEENVDYTTIPSTEMITVYGKNNYDGGGNHKYYVIEFSNIPGGTVHCKQIENKDVSFPDTVKNGYDFLGWFGTIDDVETEATADNVWDFIKPGSISISIKAVYEPEVYTISFFVGEGSAVNNATVSFDSEIDWDEYVSTRYGYSLKWLYDGDYAEDVLFKMNVADDIEVVAEWTPKEYTISFDVNEGSVVYDSIVKFDSEINWDDYVSVKEGHSLRWLFDGQDVKEVFTVMTVANDIEVVAEWTPIEYTITFVLDNGEDDIVITQNYGTSVEAPADPVKEGYDFEGWSSDIPGTMPADDPVITAEWSINEYTITFETFGGSEISDIAQDYNTSITAPDNPVKTGYVFVEWDTEIPEKMPANNLTIKAVWELKVYDEAPSADDISDIIGSNDEPIIKIDSGTEDFVIDNVIFDNIGNKVLVIDVVDNEGRTLYSWTFSGDYVDNAGSFKTKISEVEGVEEVDNLIESSGISDSLVLEFSASGILPMGALVKYYVGDKYESGRVLSLFFFNEETNRLEDEGQELTVDDDGYVTFTLIHCSVYVIGEFSESDGDSMILYVGLAVAAIVAIVAALFVIRRRA